MVVSIAKMFSTRTPYLIFFFSLSISHHCHTRHPILIAKSGIEFAGWNGSFTDPNNKSKH